MSNQDVAETYEIVWHGASEVAGEKGQLLPSYNRSCDGDVRAAKVVTPHVATRQLAPPPSKRQRAFVLTIGRDHELRRLRSQGVSLKVLAAQFHCSMTTICQLTKW
jgi:hypothetical protein